MYRSNNHGQTWVKDATIGTTPVFDLEFGGVANNYVYACTDKKFYVSNNSGSQFVQVPQYTFAVQPSNNDRATIAVTPAAPNRVYLTFGKDRLLYRSEDNGNSFLPMNLNAPRTEMYNAATAVSPTNPDLVIFGEVWLWRSVVGGLIILNTGLNTVHVDVHDIQFNPLNNYIYIATDGGVYRSTDEGVSWAPMYNGMQTTQFYHFTSVNGNNNMILGGAQDIGMIQSTNNGSTFELELMGDGFEASYPNNTSNTFFYVTNWQVSKGSRNPSVRTNITPPGTFDFYPSVAVHPTSDHVIYAGYVNGVYRSDNSGNSWTNKGASGSSGPSPSGGLAVSANMPDRVYTSNNTELWVSDNKGDTWTKVSGNPGWPVISSAIPITDITTRSNNANEIWVTLGGYAANNKVFYSSNAGATWTNLSGTLPNSPVHCIKYSSQGDAYIGTDQGVYYMAIGMSDWVPFYNGLPFIPVTDIFINESGGIIRASTFGRGIWQSELYSLCGPELFLSGITQGSNFFQSGGTIESLQEIPGSLGNTIQYRTPTKIVLKPGFSVKNNASLRMVIGDCGPGVNAVSKTEHMANTGKPQKN